jgi:hypothetical protein
MTSNAVVDYALAGTGDVPVTPGSVALTDGTGREYELINNSVLDPVDGLVLGVAAFERPPDAGQELIFHVTASGARSGPVPSISEVLSVQFARNADPEHRCCYTEGLRIAPEWFEDFGPRTRYVRIGCEWVLDIMYGDDGVSLGTLCP